jgi:hypothetical protein
MTLIADRQVPTGHVVAPGPARVRPRGAQPRRPRPDRPGGAPLRYAGTGVTMSRAAHRPRPVSAAVTVALASVAALITIWLGSLAHLGGLSGNDTPVPEQLAVVQVQAGETLQHVASRVAPDAPVGQVMQRIRDLNKLDTAALDAGQTLIAPVG